MRLGWTLTYIKELSARPEWGLVDLGLAPVISRCTEIADTARLHLVNCLGDDPLLVKGFMEIGCVVIDDGSAGIG
jgi:hypothetical protein